MGYRVSTDLPPEELRKVLVGLAFAEGIGDDVAHDLVKALPEKKQEPDAGLRRQVKELLVGAGLFAAVLAKLLKDRLAFYSQISYSQGAALPRIIDDLSSGIFVGLGYRAVDALTIDYPDLRERWLERGVRGAVSQAYDDKTTLDTSYLAAASSHARTSYRRVFNHVLDEFEADAEAVTAIAAIRGREISPQAVVGAYTQVLANNRPAFDRVAATEVRYSYHIGMLANAQKLGYTKVTFIVQPDACDDCRRIYEGRVFTIAEILHNIAATGFNSGPRSDWVALPVLHPYCRCQPVPFKG